MSKIGASQEKDSDPPCGWGLFRKHVDQRCGIDVQIARAPPDLSTCQSSVAVTKLSLGNAWQVKTGSILGHVGACCSPSPQAGPLTMSAGGVLTKRSCVLVFSCEKWLVLFLAVEQSFKKRTPTKKRRSHALAVDWSTERSGLLSCRLRQSDARGRSASQEPRTMLALPHFQLLRESRGVAFFSSDN